MSTKVKGDKIKEGSIRLSALNRAQLAFIPHCWSVWEMNLTQSYQVFPTDEIWYEDGYIYGDPVICVSDKNIFIKCENIEQNKEYQYVVNDIFTFYIKVENGDVKIKGNSDIVELLNGIVYVGIYPANLKTSSDWNAQENEHGYIKNKPDIDPVVWKYMCNPLIIKEGEEIPIELCDYDINAEGIKDNWRIKHNYRNPNMYLLIDSNSINTLLSPLKNIVLGNDTYFTYTEYSNFYVSCDYGSDKPRWGCEPV